MYPKTMNNVRSFLLIFFSIGTTSAFFCLEKTIEKIYHPVDCTKYYQCENGVYRLQQCQEGHEFDRSSNKCQVMKLKGCVNKLLLSAFDPNCPSDKMETSYFPHESECSKFYSCVNGALTIMVCEPGTEYNSERSQCETITTTGCTSKSQNYVTNDPITTTNTEMTLPNNYNPDYWFDPISTSTEITITEMSTEAATTEEATSLNPNENAVIITNTTDSSQQTPNNLCSGITLGFIPNEKDCDKYYNCLNGIVQELQCTNGTEFDPITKLCENISNNGCTASKIGVKI